jgi:hypothetical protein
LLADEAFAAFAAVIAAGVLRSTVFASAAMAPARFGGWRAKTERTQQRGGKTTESNAARRGESN